MQKIYKKCLEVICDAQKGCRINTQKSIVFYILGVNNQKILFTIASRIRNRDNMSKNMKDLYIEPQNTAENLKT